MGDLIGAAVPGKLHYLGKSEFDRVRQLNIGAADRAALFADMCRLNALYMIARAGSGHMGTTFSSLDIASCVYLNDMRWQDGTPQDVYFSSKGHDAPGLYAIFMGLGLLDFELIHLLRRLGGLPGHPDRKTPHIAANTGSLGMGVSKAKGMVFANRLLGRDQRVVVMTGDGELQEGQFWESLAGAVRAKMHEITVIVDHNKVQSDTLVERVSSLGDLAAKVRDFGWYVERIDGHDCAAVTAALAAAHDRKGVPTFIIADTIKGKGVSFIEHTSFNFDERNYKYHSGAPSAEEYLKGVDEIIKRINTRYAQLGAAAPEFETAEGAGPTPPPPGVIQRLLPAYTNALLDQAGKNAKLVALDADLILDTGLIPFQQQFPERFVECGIAEQDMVSQAGGMALKGLLPVVHSFSCFLTTRPNEQIYNNTSEHTKVVYVGSLSGLVPAGPGHSHQSLREISAVGGNPEFVMVEPATESEVALALDYALNGTKHSAFLRLISVPWAIPFTLPADYRWTEGQGIAVRDGTDVAIIAYGPIMLTSACLAAEALQKSHNISVRVINLPFLNRIDGAWLAHAVAGCKAVLTIDNQFVHMGQGKLIAASLALSGATPPGIRNLGLEGFPACGRPEEVMAHHGLDADGVAAAVLALLNG